MKMAASKIAITLENDTLKRLDMLVKSNFFPNRSKAIQEAVAEKLTRMGKSRLAQECVTADEEWTRLPVKTGPTASLFC
jgi:metal-responsive CopG/Arc/MetJ family transcriptional regulator